MALSKVRALHPDIFSDDDVCDVSVEARWLYAGLWCYSCDNGHLADKPKQIKRWIYATDDVNCAELLRELESVGLIIRVDGWILIPGLPKRQKIDWRYFKTCDRKGCENPKASKKADSQRETQRVPTVTTPGHGVATRCPATDGDGDGDGVFEGDSDGDTSVVAVGEILPAAALTAQPATEPDRFNEFWDIYPRSAGKPKAGAAYKRARRRASQQAIIDGARRYASDPNREDAYTAHATTWLNRDGWNDPPLPQRRAGPPSRLADEEAMFNRQMERALAAEASPQSVLGELA